MRALRAIACGALVTLAAPSVGVGQPLGVSQADARRLLFPQALDQRGAVQPTLLSLVVPGLGQHVLGQRRKWIYAALEVAGWVAFFERRGAGAEARGRYRDYAWDEGRLQSGGRVDGDFDYYETMSKWTASGSFDTDSGTSGVQPEMDAGTYNGSIWSLATQIFLPGGAAVPVTDPSYQAALAYYGERAYGTELLWDWTMTLGGQEEFAGLIEESDSRFRQATTAVGAVIANHLISAVDAYLSSAGRAAPATLAIVPGAAAGAAAWSAVVQIPVGR